MEFWVQYQGENVFSKPKTIHAFCIAGLFLGPSRLVLLYPRPLFFASSAILGTSLKRTDQIVPINHFYFVFQREYKSQLLTQSSKLEFIPFWAYLFSQFWIFLLRKSGQLTILFCPARTITEQETCKGEKQVNP